MKFLDLLSIIRKDPNIINKLAGQDVVNNLDSEPETIWAHAILIDSAVNKEAHTKAYIEFNNFYNTITSEKNSDLQAVIQSHLLIEYYMREFINLHINNNRLGYKKLPDKFSFSSMIELLKCINEITVSPWLKSLNELNRIRNKYAHDIKYKVKNNDVIEICKFIAFRKTIDDAFNNIVTIENIETYCNEYNVDISNFGQCIKEYAFNMCEMLHFDIYNYKKYNQYKKHTLDINKVLKKNK